MSRMSSLREPLAVDLGRDEVGEDVVGRMLRCARRPGAEVVVDLLAGRALHGHARVGVEHRVRVDLLGVEDAVAQVEEHAQLVLGQAHEPEEHRRREQLGELLGEVALAAVDERVDEAVDPRGDVVLLLVHALRREQRVEELAVLRVLRAGRR